ncbi:MAG TPA: prepilin-type N-terminal cleavage/methylation domain-containing protein [bacterium]|nr:prepilin-type N-terminal cleavage/methylation domain-containing protein [bacterium]
MPTPSPHHRTGFTVIEVLIVTMIVGLISAIAIPRFHSFRYKNQLKAAKNQLKADIRQTRTWSTAVKTGTNIPEHPYNTALAAYAVHFDPASDSYTIWEVWEDENGNLASYETETPDERKIPHALPQGIQLYRVFPANTDIYFSVPDGRLSGSLGSASFSDGKIIITLQLKTYTIEISVLEFGDVS